MARRGVVEVDRVSIQDVGAVGRSRVNILVDLSGVERCVMIVADGDGYGVGGRRLEAPSPAHKVLREGCLCVEIEVEASSSGAASVGPAAAAPAAGRSDVGVIVAIVGRRHVCGCCE